MGISTVKKTRWVRISDYERVNVPVQGFSEEQKVFEVLNKSGRLIGLKVNSNQQRNFILEIDGGVPPQTSTMLYTTGSAKWASPDLDLFVTTPSNCDISFSKSLIIKIDIGLLTDQEMTLDLHFEYDVEVSV